MGKPSPIPNNRVPTRQIDARSKTLIGYVPRPNLPGVGPAGTLNNYIVNLASIGDVNRHGIRLDHRFSDRDSVWGSYQYSNNYPNFIRGNYPEGYGHTTSAARDRSLNFTHQRNFSPRTLNEFRFGWLDHGWRQEAMNYDFDPRTLFPGLYPLPAGVGGLPNIEISNHVGIGDRGRSKQRPKQWTTQFIENFTHVRGRHSWKADNRIERGNSDSIRRHILALATDYELPFGPGKRFANVAGPLGQVAGGWQVGSIAFLRTGTPFSVGFSATQPGWRGGRADLIADPRVSRSERSLDRWFNTAAFAVPAPFTYGNSARNLLFTPGSIDVDLSLLKNTQITERFSLQLRAEFFNAANHANLGGPGTNLSVPATFGKILSWGGSRQIQFGLKLLF